MRDLTLKNQSTLEKAELNRKINGKIVSLTQAEYDKIAAGDYLQDETRPKELQAIYPGTFYLIIDE